MAINPLKIFLLAAGGSAAAATVAYVSGALDPYLAPPAAIASLPAPATTTPTSDKPADPAKPAAGAETPAAVAPAPAAPAAAAAVIAPSFDVVRVENNGSVVIAGKAAGNSKVEIVTGSKVIGAAVAGADGDFAVVLDDPLKPGDYQIVLRATAPDNVVATSTETAVVSVPSDPGGQVLALVEEPGKPAQLITVPKPADAPAAPASGEQQASAPATAPAAEPAPAKSAAPAAEIKVAVEAVEIEGKKIFIAGSADAGRKVRAYANEILIGETQTSPEGRFLIEAERELPVGDYIIRVDALEPNGAKVVARAAVPFQREPGKAVAAVAPQPTVSAAPAVDATAAAAPAPAAASTAEAKTAMAGEVPAKPADPAAEATAPAQATAPAATATADKPAEVAAAPVAPETTAPKLEAVNGAVIIRRGDSLWRISRRVYGHGVRYSNIYLANQDQIQDPDRIWPGQVFRVPEKSKEGEAANMGAMGEQAMPAPKP
ncbi:LysM peptidoglycan-binding domain-containing protein [Aminobacter sp. SR38]|jgi:nucleoid-associated protein YgaU|uniref:LysM peptidoglycan-binding domain-containing protein n=1 Tax=Aminobacter sp. SR38 TaxID=2774562 RepID=UPI00177E408F|nr:LysM peptidoglycan-binding domain-containing protein [Aminobacter sp. SR38]QOF72662.1 LysM peptidoglycan-binding domain-containing protein [Aminobacter sp. SR38]